MVVRLSEKGKSVLWIGGLDRVRDGVPASRNTSLGANDVSTLSFFPQAKLTAKGS
jgi:hypothetical protein